MPFITVRDPDSLFNKIKISYLSGPGAGDAPIDPTKPTIAWIHPTAMNAHYYDTQTADPRLKGRYNLISFDMPFHGGTTGFQMDLKQKYPLQAAGITMCSALKKLGLTKNIHIAAMAQFGFAALYALLESPDMFLSMTWLGTVLPTESAFCREGFEEMYAACLEGDEDNRSQIPKSVIWGILYAFCGEGFQMPKEMADYWFGFWNSHYQPTKPLNIHKFFDLLLNRKPISAEKLRKIATKIHCVHGEMDFLNGPLSGVLEEFKSSVPRSTVQITVIPSGCHWVLIHPVGLTASIAYWDVISYPNNPSITGDAFAEMVDQLSLVAPASPGSEIRDRWDNKTVEVL